MRTAGVLLRLSGRIEALRLDRLVVRVETPDRSRAAAAAGWVDHLIGLPVRSECSNLQRIASWVQFSRGPVITIVRCDNWLASYSEIGPFDLTAEIVIDQLCTGEPSIVQDGFSVAIEQKPPTEERLDDQVSWYDRKSQTAQRRYKTLKLAQVIIAALIPLASTFPIPAAEFKWVMAILGLLVLTIEAVQQLNQDQQNWTAYRSACEALKHEKYLYLAGAGPYSNAESAEKRLALLADRIEGLISQEHAKWVSAQERAVARDRGAGTPTTPAEEVGKHS